MTGQNGNNKPNEAKGLALTPTDDERAIFDAIADRLGEHSQATNYEIADSGEYETKLRGPVDVEVLAEWLLPTVLGFRRSVVPEPSAEVLSDWFTSSHGVAVAAVKPMTDRGPSVMVDGRVISPNDVAALIEFKAQPEPSDAQVEAAWSVLEQNGLTVLERSNVRAALRAAGVVTQEGESRG